VGPWKNPAIHGKTFIFVSFPMTILRLLLPLTLLALPSRAESHYGGIPFAEPGWRVLLELDLHLPP